MHEDASGRLNDGERWDVFRGIARGRRLSSAGYRVLAVLLEELSQDEWRPVKQQAIGRELGLFQQQVSRVIARELVGGGLIEEGPREGPGKVYRLRPVDAGVPRRPDLGSIQRSIGPVSGDG